MEMLLAEMAERGEFQKREAMETKKVFQEEKSGQWCRVRVRALVRWRMTTLLVLATGRLVVLTGR